LRKPKFVPVKFHNLSGYDAHLFVKNLNTMGEGDIDCIPNIEEKYISFSNNIYDDEKKFKYKIRFIDSFRFLPASLDKLVGNLEPNQFKYTRKTFGDECDLLLRKGVFADDWFDSFEKLNETKLPPKEEFYSKLNDSEISDSDYEHAQKVWNHFGMKTSVNIVICISKQKFISWQMSLKISEAFVWKIMSWTLVGITPRPD